jgi:hypothetical protein
MAGCLIGLGAVRCLVFTELEGGDFERHGRLWF